jgi:hypothetical protein
VGLIDQPWTRVKTPPPIPSEDELPSALTAMAKTDFAHLIRSHLLPRENEPGGRQRWLALWDAIGEHDQLTDRTFDALEDFLDATEEALERGDLDDAAAARAQKFRRACNDAWQRLQNTGDDTSPLGWAGRAAAGFNPVSRRVIARLVEAVDQHRQTVLATDARPSDEDRQLWAVLREVGLDPRRRRHTTS